MADEKTFLPSESQLLYTVSSLAMAEMTSFTDEEKQPQFDFEDPDDRYPDARVEVSPDEEACRRRQQASKRRKTGLLVCNLFKTVSDPSNDKNL